MDCKCCGGECQGASKEALAKEQLEALRIDFAQKCFELEQVMERRSRIVQQYEEQRAKMHQLEEKCFFMEESVVKLTIDREKYSLLKRALERLKFSEEKALAASSILIKEPLAIELDARREIKKELIELANKREKESECFWTIVLKDTKNGDENA